MNNRDNVFVVLRRYGILNNTHCISVCRTAEAAQDLADAYTQEYIDRDIQGFKFEVQVAGWVDE